MNFVKPLEHELTLEGVNAQCVMANAPTQTEVEQIAARLRQGQEALGLKPAEVCRLSKIRPNTYSQWINAKGRPRLDEAKLLRKAFGYTLDWIYEGDMSGLPHGLAAKIAELEARDNPPKAAPRGQKGSKAA